MTDTTALKELLEKVDGLAKVFRGNERILRAHSHGEKHYPNRCHLKGREIEAGVCATALEALIAEQEST